MILSHSKIFLAILAIYLCKIAIQIKESWIIIHKEIFFKVRLIWVIYITLLLINNQRKFAHEWIEMFTNFYMKNEILAEYLLIQETGHLLNFLKVDWYSHFAVVSVENDVSH